MFDSCLRTLSFDPPTYPPTPYKETYVMGLYERLSGNPAFVRDCTTDLTLWELAEKHQITAGQTTLWEVRKKIQQDQALLATIDPPVSRTPTETHEHKGDMWEVTLPKTRISTLDELIEHCKVDLLIWEVERFIVNKWEVGAKNSQKVIVVEPLFQVKAWLKKKAQNVAALDEIEQLRKKAGGYAPVYAPILHRVCTTEPLMLEIALQDHHFLKLAWSAETGGWGNYDLKIAESLWETAVSELLRRVSGFQFDQILFLLGNDILHTDNKQGTTTAGTHVDVDGRYHKGFGVARDACIRSIEAFRRIAPVKVVCVPGNHDNLSAWHLGDTLQSWFRLCPDVEIDNGPASVKYHRFGKVLLGFCHGDKGKKEDYPLRMAQEAKVEWAETEYREIHCGHLHKLEVTEKMGVRTRILPSLCATDAWHSDSGFVGNVRSSEAFVWSSQEGLIGTAMYNVAA